MSKVTPEEFVRAWQASSSVGEAAESLGLSRRAAASRACFYRKRGVALKLFQRGSRPLDVSALNAIAEGSK